MLSITTEILSSTLEGFNRRLKSKRTGFTSVEGEILPALKKVTYTSSSFVWSFSSRCGTKKESQGIRKGTEWEYNSILRFWSLSSC